MWVYFILRVIIIYFIFNLCSPSRRSSVVYWMRSPNQPRPKPHSRQKFPLLRHPSLVPRRSSTWPATTSPSVPCDASGMHPLGRRRCSGRLPARGTACVALSSSSSSLPTPPPALRCSRPAIRSHLYQCRNWAGISSSKWQRQPSGALRRMFYMLDTLSMQIELSAAAESSCRRRLLHPNLGWLLRPSTFTTRSTGLWSIWWKSNSKCSIPFRSSTSTTFARTKIKTHQWRLEHWFVHVLLCGVYISK